MGWNRLVSSMGPRRCGVAMERPWRRYGEVVRGVTEAAPTPDPVASPARMRKGGPPVATSPALGEDVKNPARKGLFQELHRPDVAGEHDQPGALVEELDEGFANLTGVGLPQVLRALLEPALRPATWCRSLDVEIVPRHHRLHIWLVTQEGDHVGAYPVDPHHQVRRHGLAPFDDRCDRGERRPTSQSAAGEFGQWK